MTLLLKPPATLLKVSAVGDSHRWRPKTLQRATAKAHPLATIAAQSHTGESCVRRQTFSARFHTVNSVDRLTINGTVQRAGILSMAHKSPQ